MSKIKHHEGSAQFGDLLLIKKLPGKRWLMRCTCLRVVRVWQSNVIKGRTKSCGNKIVHPPPSGPAHYHWSETPTWAAVHQRLAREFGPASQHPCVCGCGPARDWSYSKCLGPDELVSPEGMFYSADLSAYLPRGRCHKKFDKWVRKLRVQIMNREEREERKKRIKPVVPNDFDRDAHDFGLDILAIEAQALALREQMDAEYAERYAEKATTVEQAQ